MKQSTWDFSALFKSDSDPAIASHRKAVTTQANNFIKSWKQNDSYLTNSSSLLTALDQYNNWLEFYSDNFKEVFYFSLRLEQDETNHLVKAKLNQAIMFSQDISNQMSFFTIRLAKIPAIQQTKFLKDKSLATYHYFLKNLFAEGAHTLSEAEEKILNLKSAPAHSNWVRMTSSLLATENVSTQNPDQKTVEANLNQLLQFLSSPKKTVREQANNQINIILSKYTGVAENEINSILQDKQIEDDLRNFTRPDAARHLSDEIDSKTVDTLVATVSKHFKVAQDYYALKAQLMGQSKLAYHERNVELGNLTAKYPYPKASQLILEAFTNLDPEFADITNQFISEHRIDVFPAKGKSGGAFCASGLKSMPIYLLLNHSDRLDDVLTMAHELGHGIHYALAQKVQPAIYYSASLATAEVASTFMEDFVLEHIVQEADDQTKLDLLMMKLNSDISTIFRQIACYNFETELHTEFRKHGYLNHDQIGTIFQRHMASYMGKAVDQPETAKLWWIYWGHIRRFFYVYSYANGLLISKALQRQVKTDPSRIKQVKQFMAAGSSNSPEAIFKALDIDITKSDFWEQGIAEIQANLKTAKALAKKLGKIK
ncbi:MAG: M3 family oligoendopeptidase [Patescibacteria group bacterium]